MCLAFKCLSLMYLTLFIYELMIDEWGEGRGGVDKGNGGEGGEDVIGLVTAGKLFSPCGAIFAFLYEEFRFFKQLV